MWMAIKKCQKVIFIRRYRLGERFSVQGSGLNSPKKGYILGGFCIHMVRKAITTPEPRTLKLEPLANDRHRITKAGFIVNINFNLSWV
jgi:hypothetical protein